jgi:hypothetical protein
MSQRHINDSSYDDLDQAAEEILTFTVSDEALEAVGKERAPMSAFTVGSSTYSN